MRRWFLLCLSIVIVLPTLMAQNPPPPRGRLGRDVQAHKVISRVDPVYPPLARQAGVRGVVMVEVVVATDGTVKEMQVKAGPPLLIQAALDAVRQWKFEPALLNGKPVEFVTTISVSFSLAPANSSPQPPTAPPAPQGGARGGTVGVAPGPSVEAAREEVRSRPNDPRAHLDLAARLRGQDLDGAIAELREALRLKPDYNQARFLLGVILFADKYDMRGAREEYLEAVRQSPNDPQAHWELASKLSDFSELDGAIAEYRAFLRLSPATASAYDTFGHLLYRKGDLDWATTQFREVADSQPDPARIHASLANGLKQNSLIAAALREYREVLRLRPDDVLALRAADQLERDSKAAEEDIAELRLWLAQHPEDFQARSYLFFLMSFTSSDPQSALQECRELIRQQPNSTIFFRPFSSLVADHDGIASAIQELRTLSEAYPQSAAARVTLANMLLTDGELEKARREVEEALRLDPNLPDAHGLLSRLLRARGDREAAAAEEAKFTELLRKSQSQLQSPAAPQELPPTSPIIERLKQRALERQRQASNGIDAGGNATVLDNPAAAMAAGLRNATMAANEATAIGALRTLNAACMAYAAKYGGFPLALANLGSGDRTQPSRMQASLIDDTLASGSKMGYVFTYVSRAPDGERITTYAIYANPITPGTTGTRFFYTDQTGIIHSNPSGRASASDPPAR